jgi:hypothetical protein
MPRITWHVLAYDGPTPSEYTDFRYRGSPEVLAVPGDTVRVQTPDGVLEGEPHAELFDSQTSFWLMTSAAVFFVGHERVEELVDDDWELLD